MKTKNIYIYKINFYFIEIEPEVSLGLWEIRRMKNGSDICLYIDKMNTETVTFIYSLSK